MANNMYQQLESSNMMAATSERDGQYLTDKRILLSNPGFKLSQNYYSTANSTVDLAETTYNYGRYSVSLSSLNFGSTSSVIIPNSDFLAQCILHVELPAIPANVCLPRGWLFNAINSLNFTVGSSSINQVSFTGQSLYQISMAQCETASKRSEVLALAGQEILTAQGAGSSADIMLILPWSGLAADLQLPVDTNLLNAPIQLQISLNPLSAFANGVGVAGMGNAFQAAAIITRQGSLLNKAAGIRDLMFKNPDLVYNYPFTFYQSYQAQVQGQTADQSISGFPQGVNIPLLSFLNGDLLGIYFGLVKVSDLTSTNSNPTNPLKYDEITNVRLTFNGQDMYAMVKNSWKLAQMNDCIDATYAQQSYINQPIVNGTAAFTSFPYNNYVSFVDFSRSRDANHHDQTSNVWRIPSNTINLQLNTTANVPYVLYATYIYNGLITFKNGATELFFS